MIFKFDLKQLFDINTYKIWLLNIFFDIIYIILLWLYMQWYAGAAIFNIKKLIGIYNSWFFIIFTIFIIILFKNSIISIIFSFFNLSFFIIIYYKNRRKWKHRIWFWPLSPYSLNNEILSLFSINLSKTKNLDA